MPIAVIPPKEFPVKISFERSSPTPLGNPKSFWSISGSSSWSINFCISLYLIYTFSYLESGSLKPLDVSIWYYFPFWSSVYAQDPSLWSIAKTIYPWEAISLQCPEEFLTSPPFPWVKITGTSFFPLTSSILILIKSNSAS